MKRFLAVLLSVVMLVSVLAVTVVAEDTNVALGKEYTTHDPLSGYNAKLTDGVKSDAMAYSGDVWFAFKCHPNDGSGNTNQSRTGTVVIDLDGLYDISEVKVWTIVNDGSGISACSEAKVYLSTDGETWGEATSLTVKAESEVSTNETYYIEGEVKGTAAYVKVDLTLGAKTFLFFDEIEVYGAEASGDAGDDDTDDTNKTERDPDFYWFEGEYVLTEGDNNVDPYHAWGYVFNIDYINAFTGPSTAIFTNATDYLKTSKWSSQVVLAPTDEENVYEVVAAYKYTGIKPQEALDQGLVNFDKGEIVLVANDSGTRPSKNEDGTLQFPNWQDRAALWGLEKTTGAKITLENVDLTAVSGTESTGTATVQDKPKAQPKLFWFTHVNNNTVEGAGSIFTEAYAGAGWWLHVAFAPVADAEGAYEIVAISNGLADGSGVAQEIPEGGFVWAANYGNDYPSIYPDDTTAIDYTSPNCSAAIADAATWTVGMQFVFDGFDPLNPVAPTSTPDVDWYDDAYVCTATYAPYEAEEGGNTDPVEPEENLEDLLKEALGAANEDPKFDLVITAPETYEAGNEITVTVEVKNITAENGLHLVKFELYYDNEKLAITNDLDEYDNNCVDCFDAGEALPNKWTNFTKVNNDYDPNGSD
ncbi:MAG: hypothetical protein IKZ05_07140, partial [Clostridia bacterium]|nr:hypothetical protein [Clostridia bacterium]